MSKQGQIVEWNEKEATGNGLPYIKGMIQELEDGRKVIRVSQYADDETALGKPKISYSLTKERIEAIKKWKN